LIVVKMSLMPNINSPRVALTPCDG
jgi:hypothetical protein